MFIDIRAIGFGITPAIREHVASHIDAALAPFARRILTVTARLEDINADRGGIDKRCSIVVSLKRRGTVIANAVHTDLYAAISRASTRLRRSAQRHLTRHLPQQRKDRQRPGALVQV